MANFSTLSLHRFRWEFFFWIGRYVYLECTCKNLEWSAQNCGRNRWEGQTETGVNDSTRNGTIGPSRVTIPVLLAKIRCMSHATPTMDACDQWFSQAGCTEPFPVTTIWLKFWFVPGHIVSSRNSNLIHLVTGHTPGPIDRNGTVYYRCSSHEY